jgi:hypothetical protein
MRAKQSEISKLAQKEIASGEMRSRNDYKHFSTRVTLIGV